MVQIMRLIFLWAIMDIIIVRYQYFAKIFLTKEINLPFLARA